jgi:hypothetical protein
MAQPWIRTPREVLQRQRALREVLEDQRRRPAALHERAHHGRGDVHAVTGEAGSAADRYGCHDGPALIRC